jgi:hypothetical protein
VGERPTIEELRQRIAVRERVETGETAAAAIRAERDASEAQPEETRIPGHEAIVEVI